MKLAALPMSKAKTAYELLGEIRKLILEEPKRYDQMNVLYRVTPSDGGPSCSTVGCVAGWVCVLTGNRRVSDWMETAARVLGLVGLQRYRLFRAEAAGDNSLTIEHATLGAAHIERFRKRHAKQLKRTRV